MHIITLFNKSFVCDLIFQLQRPLPGTSCYVIDLVNSSPNILWTKSGISSRKSEFGAVAKIDISRFLFFVYLLIWDSSDAGLKIMVWWKLLEFWAVSRSHVGWWKRACRTKGLHWGRVSRYTGGAAACSQTPGRYTFATYIIHTRHTRPKFTHSIFCSRHHLHELQSS